MIKINSRQAIPLGILVFGFILFSIQARSFLTFHNMLSILGLITYTAVPTMGLAVVMLTGLFDLSFVGVIGILSTLLLTFLSVNVPPVLGLLITLAVAMVMESFNALLIVKLKIHPWLSTIATMLMYLGLEQYISKGTYLSTKHPILAVMRYNTFFGISLSVWLMLAVAVLISTVMSRTVLGRRLYAVGGSEVTARKAGINTGAYYMISFLIMGFMCWVSSIIYVSQLSGYPPQAAYINQNEVILAVFVGMAISRKGIVSVHGAFFGAAFVGFLANGLGLMGVSSYWIKLVEGALVVVVVLGNSIKQGKLVQLE
ncbi:MAG: ABC transporter permease [Treponema sp.]|nr:ABC transporter permease [Treponema sp.]